jgi:Fungal Zn(2)-Cys(6) binuclear cluster domain
MSVVKGILRDGQWRFHGGSTEVPGSFRTAWRQSTQVPPLFILLLSSPTNQVSRVASVISVTMQRQPPIERRSRPRQEPVSCQSCRAKKLRCNRQWPCSNCLSRGITCQHPSLPPPISEPSEREPTTSTSSGNDSAAILARLKRLEDVVLGLNGAQIPSPRSDALRSHSVTSSVRSRGDETDSGFLEDVGSRTASLVGAVPFL